MSTCENCGAQIDLARTESVRCKFCEAMNQPAPKEVAVPVPVQVVNQVVQVMAGSAAAQALDLRCPHCRRRLATVRVAGVDLNGCGACGGIWIDNEGAAKVMASPQAVFAELAGRAASNANRMPARAKAPVCAACPATLDRVKAHALDLDICAEHGTWFDAWELKQLVERLLSPLKPLATRAPEDVACVCCQAKITREQTNVTGAGPMCDACWRKEQLVQLEKGSNPGALGTVRFLEGDAGGRQFSVPARDHAATNTTSASLVIGALGVLLDISTSRS